MRGQLSTWRISVGDYRVIYKINDDNRIIEVVMVCHRSQAYK
ncbi:hypothetical protein F7734_21245 [Scytonema sp. UIC 10036]|nr:hypothetical protein [Scytonema sp. UIC 10036]